MCISITDPGKLPARLSGRFQAILRLSFTDVAELSGLDGEILFDKDHAHDIITFIVQQRGVDRIVIHCRAGLSRSPGIAVGLCELFAWGSHDELQNQHPLCNKWVRNELVRVGRGVLNHGVVQP